MPKAIFHEKVKENAQQISQTIPAVAKKESARSPIVIITIKIIAPPAANTSLGTAKAIRNAIAKATKMHTIIIHTLLSLATCGFA